MAENWWGSWITSAKNKSAEVLEAVRKDLGEITTAVKGEATAATSAIEKSLKLDEPDSTASQMKKSLSTFLGQMNTVLNPTPDDEDTEAILITSDQGAVALNGLQKFLLELQLKDATYLTAPEPDLQKQYDRWLEVLADHQLTEERLSRHLASSSVLQDKYRTLVPDQVGHQDFWMRYLFRKALLEDGVAQAEATERKARLADNITTDSTSTTAPSPTTVQPSSSGSPLHLVVGNGDIRSSISSESLKSQSQCDQCISTQSIAGSEQSSPSQSTAMHSSFSALEPLADPAQVTDEALRWELEDFSCDVELSEEEQLRLLQEYEQEIANRSNNSDKSKKGMTKSESSLTNNKKTTIANKSNESVEKTEKSASKTSSTDEDKKQNIAKQVKTKSNKKGQVQNVIKTSKSNDLIKKSTVVTKEVNQKVDSQTEDVGDELRDSPLIIDSNHFLIDKSEIKTDKSEIVLETKPSSDNRSNNSDESWEKEFEDFEE